MLNLKGVILLYNNNNIIIIKPECDGWLSGDQFSSYNFCESVYLNDT